MDLLRVSVDEHIHVPFPFFAKISNYEAFVKDKYLDQFLVIFQFFNYQSFQTEMVNSVFKISLFSDKVYEMVFFYFENV